MPSGQTEQRWVARSSAEGQTARRPGLAGTSRRIVHGGYAWTGVDSQGSLRQPQDGAGDPRMVAEIADAGALQQGPRLNGRATRMQLNEPEDARLTGGTRSLMRRVMGLNVTTRPETRRLPGGMQRPGAQRVTETTQAQQVA